MDELKTRAAVNATESVQSARIEFRHGENGETDRDFPPQEEEAAPSQTDNQNPNPDAAPAFAALRANRALTMRAPPSTTS